MNKTLQAGLRSWKTTLLAAALAGLVIMQDAMGDGVQLSDPELWIAVAIAVLGFLVRDADKSSQDVGIRSVLLLWVAASALIVSGCAGQSPEWLGQVKAQVRVQNEGAKAGLEVGGGAVGVFGRLVDEQGNVLEGEVFVPIVAEDSGK